MAARRGRATGRALALAIALALTWGCGAATGPFAPEDGDAGPRIGGAIDPRGRVFASGPLPSCPGMSGVPRDCGLVQIGSAFLCTPGEMTTVGCNANCSLGMCTGDPVLQVCPATGPCDRTTSIGANDDTSMCGGSTLCSVVRFVCPADGRFAVYGGAFGSRAGSTCDIAVR